MQFIYELPRLAARGGQELLLLLPQQYPEFISEEQARAWSRQIIDEVASAGQAAVGYSLSGITVLMAVLIYCVLVPILVFFLLKDSEQMVSWFTGFLPRRRQLLTRIWQEMDIQIANYIRGKALEILIVGTVSYAAFLLLGLNYAALLAVSVGLSVLVPYIGAAVVTIPIALVGYVQWGFQRYLYLADGGLRHYSGARWQRAGAAVVFRGRQSASGGHYCGGTGVRWPVGRLGVFFAIPLATLLKAVVQAWPDREALSAGSSD